nr:immunoglobulin heavy chain junction region [Macaca mulatta]
CASGGTQSLFDYW